MRGVHIPVEVRATAVLYYKMGGFTPKQCCIKTKRLFSQLYPDVVLKPGYMSLWMKCWKDEWIQWCHEDAVKEYLAATAKLELDKISQHLKMSGPDDPNYTNLFRVFLQGIKYIEERQLTKEDEKKAMANPAGFITNWINKQIKQQDNEMLKI